MQVIRNRRDHDALPGSPSSHSRAEQGIEMIETLKKMALKNDKFANVKCLPDRTLHALHPWHEEGLLGPGGENNWLLAELSG